MKNHQTGYWLISQIPHSKIIWGGCNAQIVNKQRVLLNEQNTFYWRVVKLSNM